MNAQFLILIVVSYLLGSIPFGVIISRAHGKDLQKIGSGNIGATNVARALGRKWAYVCFALDVLKGLVPMLASKLLISEEPTIAELSLWLVVGCAAIAGHVFSVYLRFKGGKGVSTCLGVVLGLFPYYTIPGLIAFAIWIACVLMWRYISLASIIAALMFPLILIVMIILRGDWSFACLWPLVLVAFLMLVLVLLRHVENIKRLLDGSEGKILQK